MKKMKNVKQILTIVEIKSFKQNMQLSFNNDDELISINKSQFLFEVNKNIFNFYNSYKCIK